MRTGNGWDSLYIPHVGEAVEYAKYHVGVVVSPALSYRRDLAISMDPAKYLCLVEFDKQLLLMCRVVDLRLLLESHEVEKITDGALSRELVTDHYAQRAYEVALAQDTIFVAMKKKR